VRNSELLQQFRLATYVTMAFKINFPYSPPVSQYELDVTGLYEQQAEMMSKIDSVLEQCKKQQPKTGYVSIPRELSVSKVSVI